MTCCDVTLVAGQSPSPVVLASVQQQALVAPAPANAPLVVAGAGAALVVAAALQGVVSLGVPVAPVLAAAQPVVPNVVFVPLPPVVVVATGLRGPPGPPGTSSGFSLDIDPFPFSYGDGSPGLVYTVPVSADGLLEEVTLVIEEPFDGVGAQLELRSGAAILLAAADNDPSVKIGYSAFPDLQMSQGQTVQLYITPGAGAASGSGYVLLRFAQLN